MTALSNWFQGIDLSRVIQWLMFGGAALIAISVHESSHALSASWLGDDTAKRMGRISLNPLRHLDPVGFLMMVVAHFGWAKPVPVNMYRFKNPKLGMALTAAAGPVSNVLLAFHFGVGQGKIFADGVDRLIGDIAFPSLDQLKALDQVSLVGCHFRQVSKIRIHCFTTPFLIMKKREPVIYSLLRKNQTC